MQDPLKVLDKWFGFPSFRGGQRESIDSILNHQDTLYITPTGGGKSLVYQIPALILPGLTIVVSPLISLMKDQVDGLTKRNIPAVAYNSTVNDSARADIISNVNNGTVKMLFMAPEGLTPTFMNKLDVEVSLLAVDESHCVSKWGHDFRPKYLQLANIRKQLGNPTCLAVTATATKEVRDDIVEHLEMKNAKRLIYGFDRPNLEISVIKGYGPQKLDGLFEFVDNIEGSMIVYCGTRTQVEEISDVLCRSGFSAKPYHGGMTAQKRTAVQEAFMSDEAQLIVATNAFGMGVDKPSIRGIAHMQMPGSVEAYYQEIGRAGRDGEPARVTLLYKPSDRSLQDFFVNMSWPPNSIIETVYEYTLERLSSTREGELFISQDKFAAEIGEWVKGPHIGAVWGFMAQAGVLKKFRANDIGTVAIIEPKRKIKGRSKTVLDYLAERCVAKHVWFEVSTLDMAKNLGIEKKHVSAALRSLNNVAIEYRPPERSGGVKLIVMKDINDAIDWKTVEARRTISRNLIDRMVGFCETEVCRRKQILDYFGDTSKPVDWECGTCDICLQK